MVKQRAHTRIINTKRGRRAKVINPFVHKRSISHRKPKLLKHKFEQVPDKLRKQIFKEELRKMAQELNKTKRANLPGVGILKVKSKPARKARQGINPFTKEKMMIKAKPRSKVIKFRPGKDLRGVLGI